MTQEDRTELFKAVSEYLYSFASEDRIMYAPWAFDSTGFQKPLSIAEFAAEWMEKRILNKKENEI